MAAVAPVREVSGTPFRELVPSLSEPSLNLLDQLGFKNATPVQSAAIPLFCSYKDVYAEAVTGSGKTLAFVLPAVEILLKVKPPLKPHQVGAIIISPTRELAAQIFSVAEPFFSTVVGLKSHLLVGGTSVAEDLSHMAESGANVLVGTPGRLEDVLDRAKSLDVRQLEVLILDEADRLLDMGFQRQLSSILDKLPRQRRTGLFSATQTEAVDELARSGMRNPVRVHISTESMNPGVKDSESSQKTPTGLKVEYMVCPIEERPSQVVALLSSSLAMKTIVYVMTCACADYWGTALSRLHCLKKTAVIILHGQMKQSNRQAALSQFVDLPSGILVCTDVAARGLDIPGVDLIVQMDAPQDPKAFVHRSGRTARMGRSGSAIIFLAPEEDTYVEFMKLRGVPMQERTKSDNVADVTPMLREAAMADRDIMEKGLKAFVSFFRGYKEHHCNFIFKWKDLPLGRLGMAFGLLHLPSMPELKRKPKWGDGFLAMEGIDFDAIKYKDKLREKQRRSNLKRKAEVKEEVVPKLEMKAKCRVLDEEGSPGGNIGQLAGTVEGEEDDEEEEMGNDYRLLKKLKKGAITEAEFDEKVGLDGQLVQKAALVAKKAKRKKKVAVANVVKKSNKLKTGLKSGKKKGKKGLKKRDKHKRK